MIFNEIFGICGPSCKTCQAYIATRSGKEALAKIALEWTIAMNRTFTADDIICDGCRVSGGRRSAYCGGCDIRNCAISKGHDMCSSCESSPCEKIVAPPALEAIKEQKQILKGYKK